MKQHNVSRIFCVVDTQKQVRNCVSRDKDKRICTRYKKCTAQYIPWPEIRNDTSTSRRILIRYDSTLIIKHLDFQIKEGSACISRVQC